MSHTTSLYFFGCTTPSDTHTHTHLEMSFSSSQKLLSYIMLQLWKKGFYHHIKRKHNHLFGIHSQRKTGRENIKCPQTLLEPQGHLLPS